MRLARQLEELTHLESRVTILGYLQRGGIPSPVDRLLATRLGGACADLIHDNVFGVMVAARGDRCSSRRARDKNCCFNLRFLFVVGGDLVCDGLDVFRLHQGNRAAAEPAAGHPAAVNAALDSDGFGNLNDGVQLLAAHFVIVAQ